ncbi:hypothetical protein [Anaerospora sp.]|uniref:hypothetical protein n=1 Tax=Anaerospora sp. TaxID=1960278 RepID=UPI0028A04277|nr:hypothetical protein [Anaerospora sp.]
MLTIKGEAARKIVRELECPTEEEIADYKAIRMQVEKAANMLRQIPDCMRIGCLVQKGITEVLPHTSCKGEFNSIGCREVLKTNQHGCVLMYYCREGSNEDRATRT